MRTLSGCRALVSTVAASAGAGFTAANLPIARVAATKAATRDH